MAVPTMIEIRCWAGEDPIVGCWVQLTLAMTGKNPYRLLFGPADSDGVVRVRGDELLAAAQREGDLFPMDYLGFPAAWTGQLDAEVLDRPGIDRLRNAQAVWGDVGFYPDGDPTLQDYERRLESFAGQRLRATVLATE